MDLTIKTKNNCNIYIPRTVYSLYIILSKNKSVKEDNFIIINNFNLEKIPNDLIDLLKKKFSIIFVHKNYSYKKFQEPNRNIIKKFTGINHLINLENLSNKILKTNYPEFSKINFNNYKSINIYYSSSIFYFSNLCKKFNNVKLYFLEHGSGNFLSFVYEDHRYNHDYKYRIKMIFTSIIFKIKGIYIPSESYYYGSCGKIFNTQKLTNNNYMIKFYDLNYRKGFNHIFDFYKEKLSKIKKKKYEYLYLQLPHAYDFNIYKKFLNEIAKKSLNKKNFIFLIKLKATHTNKKNKYSIYLKKFFKKEKISFYFLDEKYKMIPAEVILKFFKVKEIYSGYSTILFSSFYFINRKMKINAFISNLVKKKYKNHIELKPFINKFIKKKYINKNVSYTEVI